VSAEDYALNLLLVAVVVRQIRGKRLTPFGLLWPLALVGWAAVEYLHGIPSAGHDPVLAGCGALCGATLGVLCGVCTRIEVRPDRSVVARAGAAAAGFWVAGVGARMGFAVVAENGGAAAIGRFSAAHQITGAGAWTACLFLMSLCEVLSRTVVLGLRGHRARRDAAALVMQPRTR
jgi:hypothetical protein